VSPGILPRDPGHFDILVAVFGVHYKNVWMNARSANRGRREE
jgi:hypothetical protein